MNIRSFSRVLVAISLVGMVGVYAQKTQSYDILRERSQLAKQLEQERTELMVLRAEWAYLSRAEEMQRFVAMRHGLSNMAPAQMVSVDDIRYIAKFHAYGSPDVAQQLSELISQDATLLERIVATDTPAN